MRPLPKEKTEEATAFRPRLRDMTSLLLAEGLCHGEHLIGLGAHAYILGEVNPAHRAGRVHQKFSGTRNVNMSRTATRMHQIVAADYLGLWIRQEGKSIVSLRAQFPRLLGAVNTDCYWTYAGGLKLLKLTLNAS